MEGMLVTIYDTLNYLDYDSILSIIATLSGGQATPSKLKDDIEEEKRLTTQL